MPHRLPLEYVHLGKCTCVCQHCSALFWESEKYDKSRVSSPEYHKCCSRGRVILRAPPEYPEYIKQLYRDHHFIENIRAYNQMFSMTSLGANVDNSINNGKGPYVFRVSGQIYHWIGAMCPEEGERPSYTLVVCTRENMSYQPAEADIPEFKVKLYNVVGTREYELPTAESIGAIVFGETSSMENDFDLIVEQHSRFPHIPGQSTKSEKRMTMNMYYAYQIHDRLNHYNLLPRGGKLFQQYVVTAYCSIEQSRLDYIRQKQNDIRNEYLSGIYDAIMRGDYDGNDLGTRTILTASFTGGPRYMYSHYLDALAICRVHGNPSFFITFTCNAKWPEILEYMDSFPELTPADRADIVDRVFERKIRDYVKFIRNERPFGDITA
ncbi:DNA helicase, partial [Tanacetum coccineum]